MTSDVAPMFTEDDVVELDSTLLGFDAPFGGPAQQAAEVVGNPDDVH